MKHKHAELIKAWADGAIIQFYAKERDKWLDCLSPSWVIEVNYRIKPEPKPDVVRFLGMREFCLGKWEYAEDDFDMISHWPCKLKLTFNGETGKLINAEIL